MRKVLVLIIFLLVYARNFVDAQDKKGKELIDSLVTVLEYDKHKQDTNKVNTMNRLSELYLKTNKYEESILQSKEALLVSEKIKFLSGQARAFYNIGFANSHMGNFKEALHNYSQSLNIYEGIGNKISLSLTLSSMGIAFKNIGNYPQAIDCYYKSLKISEELSDKKAVIRIMLNIGNIFTAQRNYQSALTIYLEALTKAEELGNKSLLAANYDCLGSVYSNYLGKYDEALLYFEKSLEIRKESENRGLVASLYNNIGVVQFKQEKNAEAKRNHLAALEINEERKDKQGIEHSCHLLANILAEEKNYSEAHRYYDKSLMLAKETNSKNSLYEIYYDMAQLDSAQSNFSQAWENINLSNKYHDSIMNEEASAQITEQKMQYEFDRKNAVTKLNFEHQQDSIKLENEKQQLALQKEMQLKALRFEFAKKQALAKSEKENQELKFEEELKRNQINFDFQQKELTIETQQRQKEAQFKVQQYQRDAKAKQHRNLLLGGFGVAGLSGLFFFFYYKQKQNARRKLEMEVVKQRISRDLHDDIGSTLSTISKYAELACKKLQNEGQVSDLLVTVNDISKEMLTRMNDIVWSINPKNDSIEHLLNRLKNYCASSLASGQIHHQFNIDEKIVDTPLNSVQLKEIYLIGKEAINNSMKYSNCKDIQLNFSKQNNQLFMEIKDDGIGFSKETFSNPLAGMGLKNMKARAQEILATLNIISSPNEGCSIQLVVPLS